jgi:hypothetical protein
LERKRERERERKKRLSLKSEIFYDDKIVWGGSKIKVLFGGIPMGEKSVHHECEKESFLK